MGMKDVRVYAGGWLNKETNKYVLDASVIIDNKADALYIANAGKQDAIFDLGEFNEIKTSEGIEELKQSGSYDINKFNVRQSDNVKLVEGFETARMESQGGAKKRYQVYEKLDEKEQPSGTFVILDTQKEDEFFRPLELDEGTDKNKLKELAAEYNAGEEPL
jgi:hypothetical protein